jgi:nucleoside 2-deoxyribosyltransferase
MKVYLAGPIAGCTDEQCNGWRNTVTAMLGEENVLNPMRRDYRGFDVAPPAEIVEQDKADIDASTCVLVYYEQPSVGTSMEVLYAWERGKPVVIVTEQQYLSPWLVYHAAHIVRSLGEAVWLIRNGVGA